jgi:hypothetical protein
VIYICVYDAHTHIRVHATQSRTHKHLQMLSLSHSPLPPSLPPSLPSSPSPPFPSHFSLTKQRTPPNTERVHRRKRLPPPLPPLPHPSLSHTRTHAHTHTQTRAHTHKRTHTHSSLEGASAEAAVRLVPPVRPVAAAVPAVLHGAPLPRPRRPSRPCHGDGRHAPVEAITSPLAPSRRPPRSTPAARPPRDGVWRCLCVGGRVGGGAFGHGQLPQGAVPSPPRGTPPCTPAASPLGLSCQVHHVPAGPIMSPLAPLAPSRPRWLHHIPLAPSRSPPAGETADTFDAGP